MEKSHLESALQTDVCFLVCIVGWGWGCGSCVYLRRPPVRRLLPPTPLRVGLHQIWHCRKTSIFSHPHPKNKSVPHRIRHLVHARECFGFPKFIACSHLRSNHCYWFTHPSWLVDLNEDATNWRKTLSLEGTSVLERCQFFSTFLYI